MLTIILVINILYNLLHRQSVLCLDGILFYLLTGFQKQSKTKQRKTWSGLSRTAYSDITLEPTLQSADSKGQRWNSFFPALLRYNSQIKIAYI